MIEFICFKDQGELPDSAYALFRKFEKNSVFFSQLWLENLQNTGLDEGQVLTFATVVDRGKVLALLPLVRHDGGHYYSPGNLYTSLFTLYMVEENQPEILQCLAQGLANLPVRSLRFDPVAEDDTMLLLLQEALETSGFQCQRFFRFYNWIYRVQGQSFKDYMAARPSRVRNTIARKRRKLERELGYQIRLFTDDNLSQGLADYQAVYDASWKVREQFGGFVEGLAMELSSKGWLRLAVLYIEGKPAAAQFWFVVHGKASIFKLAYGEAWKQYSPGSILIAYLMEHVIDVDKVEEIDFLTGNDSYKQDWMAERRVRWRLACSNMNAAKPDTGGVTGFPASLLKRLRNRLYNPLFLKSEEP